MASAMLVCVAVGRRKSPWLCEALPPRMYFENWAWHPGLENGQSDHWILGSVRSCRINVWLTCCTQLQMVGSNDLTLKGLNHSFKRSATMARRLGIHVRMIGNGRIVPWIGKTDGLKGFTVKEYPDSRGLTGVRKVQQMLSFVSVIRVRDPNWLQRTTWRYSKLIPSLVRIPHPLSSVFAVSTSRNLGVCLGLVSYIPQTDIILCRIISMERWSKVVRIKGVDRFCNERQRIVIIQRVYLVSLL